MEHLTFSTLDPAFNLALEEVLFQSLPAGHPGWFLLWQNGPSVIVGRHQCTADEVNADFIRRENLPVVRRITGGGAVYHDTGNLNFSFIEHANGREKVDFRRYLEPVCAALADLGVQAVLSGRNDIEANGRKISGSGQMLRRGKVLHHGTLLIDVNFERLSSVLFSLCLHLGLLVLVLFWPAPKAPLIEPPQGRFIPDLVTLGKSGRDAPGGKQAVPEAAGLQRRDRMVVRTLLPGGERRAHARSLSVSVRR